jgi:hypothetical protein
VKVKKSICTMLLFLLRDSCAKGVNNNEDLLNFRYLFVSLLQLSLGREREVSLVTE